MSDRLPVRTKVMYGAGDIGFSLTSEDNPRTPMLAERFGARIYKRYRTYRMKIKT